MSSNLLKELEESYLLLQRTQSIQASLDELDSAFYVRDGVLANGYLSASLSSQLCARIAEIFMNWNTYLHGLVMPDPHYLIQMNESKFLGPDDKKRILSLIARSMELVSRNTLFHARPDSKTEASFIDEALLFWRETYQPQLVSVIELLRARWSG